jgi:hypothetical protein
VLTAASPLPAEERAAMSMTPEQDAARLAAWIELQGELARWSTASRHALVVGASHYIQFDRPDVVIRAARHVVESVRAAAEARNGAYGCVRPRA